MMRINRISLSNISSYSGDCELDFTVGEECNIVLIGGQNGSGKTSLFTAIKLALYGPLCFRFQSRNNQYTARIKELISHDAFAQNDVHAYIELEIELPREGDMIAYVIRREWDYTNQKLSEKDTVWEGGTPLSEDDFDTFQNYLYSVIPPNLFDFFFFDGEEIANFFSIAGSNSYIKDAIFTLDSYDTFGLIDRFCRRYTRCDSDSEQYDKLNEVFQGICDEIDGADAVQAERDRKVSELEERIIEIDQEIKDMGDRFDKAGGISKTRRAKLKKESKEWELIRERASDKLRAYVENTMPLVLTHPVAKNLREQLRLEDQMQQYRILTEQMSVLKLGNVLSEMQEEYQIADIDKFLRRLSTLLTESLKPDIDLDKFVFLHDFSHEQRDLVISVLGELERFNKQDVIELVEKKTHASREGIRIRAVIDRAMDELDADTYEAKVAELREEKAQAETMLLELDKENKAFQEHIELLRKRYQNMRPTLSSLSRKINSYKYTQRISSMMQRMLGDLLQSKRLRIEEETLRLSKEILRKEHFIDLIELDDQFDFSLFREQNYTYHELALLFSNIGATELAYRIGNKGLQILLDHFGVSDLQELKNIFHDTNRQATMYDNMVFTLYKRIEFQQLSKGEKQIFILSLYWAIIHSSDRDIPFIIDTPYARIDMEHREQIAKKLFPNISKQVIIFSTDEEIIRQYYDAVKPYLAKEYTLEYDETNGKTVIKEGYFTQGVHHGI